LFGPQKGTHLIWRILAELATVPAEPLGDIRQR
jgi:hypothetical protein